MKNNILKQISAIGLSILFAASPVFAQERGHGGTMRIVPVHSNENVNSFAGHPAYHGEVQQYHGNFEHGYNNFNRGNHVNVNINVGPSRSYFHNGYWNHNFVYWNNYRGYWYNYNGFNTFIILDGSSCEYWDGSEFVVFEDNIGLEYCSGF